MKPSSKFVLRCLAPGLLLTAGGCIFPNTQRWPPPMGGDFATLPPGDAATRREGVEEVTVIRHADPVRVRPVGALAGQPLAFYDKRMRTNAGSAVIVSPGGRAEVLWASGSSIVMFGKGVAWIGSTGRGEPMFDFQELDRARLMLHEGDRVRLLGGAELSGPAGPYVVERRLDQKLDVINQSKQDLTVEFREELFTLGPGHKLGLPILSEGGAPIRPDPSAVDAAGPGFSVRLTGAALPRPDESGLEFTATGDSLLEGFGQRVQLKAGESGRFTGFARSEGQKQ